MQRAAFNILNSGLPAFYTTELFALEWDRDISPNDIYNAVKLLMREGRLIRVEGGGYKIC